MTRNLDSLPRRTINFRMLEPDLIWGLKLRKEEIDI